MSLTMTRKPKSPPGSFVGNPGEVFVVIAIRDVIPPVEIHRNTQYAGLRSVQRLLYGGSHRSALTSIWKYGFCSCTEALVRYSISIPSSCHLGLSMLGLYGSSYLGGKVNP